jgi:hypothetical protein
MARAANAHHTAGTRRVSAAGFRHLKPSCHANPINYLVDRFAGSSPICPASQCVSVRPCALDRAAFLGARDREAVRAGGMGKGLALI